MRRRAVFNDGGYTKHIARDEFSVSLDYGRLSQAIPREINDRVQEGSMNVTPPIHVSIISDYGIEVPVSQEMELSKELNGFCSNPAGQVVLHHGCSTEADAIAHRLAFAARWWIEGHPAYDVNGIVPWQPAIRKNQIKVIHPARLTKDRDEDLICASGIIVAVQPLRGSTSTLLGQVTDEGWQVIYIEEPELKRHTIPAQREAEAADSWAAQYYWHNWLVDAWR
jgi:hypothetical protein